MISALADLPVALLDSVTQTNAAHAGCVVVTGSHGGASAAKYALDVQAALYIFNDAGVGKDGAGISGLLLLDEAGIAAATVMHASARIGDAHDTFEFGLLSHVNRAAAALGLAVGQKLRGEVLAANR